MKVALGFRAHSGWAALVAVSGSPRTPVVIERRRIELADPKVRGTAQPYHAAEGLELSKAKALLQRHRNASRRLARQSLDATLRHLKNNGHTVSRCGLLLASGRPLPGLAATLASHALIHTADGEFFRDAIVHACEHRGLPVLKVRERELYDHASKISRIPVAQLRNRFADLGRDVGPPWREDQKLAALSACLALVARSRG